MKKMFLAVACVLMATVMYGQGNKDWANYGRYARDNAELSQKPDVVFMGNSITEGWARQHPSFFEENNYVGRGISGQVTAQMLARFQSDVVALSPKVVVILAGTNDVAQNNGIVSLEHIVQNIASMADIAEANGIKPVLCSVLPAASFGWRPEVTDSAQQIIALNKMIAELAAKRKLPYVDYHSAMDDGNGGLPEELAGDGVHPNSTGYDVMEKTITPVLGKMLKKK